jgi:hypothetical protein
MRPKRKAGVSTAPRSFGGKRAGLQAHLAANRNALKRAIAAGHRLEAQRARYDMRDWAVKRRERTRHLIELGGLIVKVGLVELTGDDRALLYGAFLEIVDALQSKNCEQIITLWRRRGRGRLLS